MALVDLSRQHLDWMHAKWLHTEAERVGMGYVMASPEWVACQLYQHQMARRRHSRIGAVRLTVAGLLAMPPETPARPPRTDTRAKIANWLAW